jgi:hypothetical protein
MCHAGRINSHYGSARGFHFIREERQGGRLADASWSDQHSHWPAALDEESQPRQGLLETLTAEQICAVEM